MEQDPHSSLPAWARPSAVIFIGAAVYAAIFSPWWLLVTAETSRVQAVLFWALAGVGAGVPCAIALSAAAIHREFWVLGGRHPGRFLWVGHACGAMAVAHALGMLAWTPARLAAMGAGLDGERIATSALIGLIPWVVAALGCGLMLWTRWNMGRRPVRVRPGSPSRIPHGLVVVPVFASLYWIPAALVVFGLASEGYAWTDLWAAVVGSAGLGLLVALPLGWSFARADIVRNCRLGAPPIPFNRVLGRALFVQAIVAAGMVFAASLVAPWENLGLGFGMQIGALAVATVLVAWSLGARGTAGTASA